ncbi:MAG: formylglycine-generating enzyme family protein [Prevotellaceae bacterium]|jgi:formylglycine-generating enzyme required for sulfatase activity|nr:formylglycine-generating enzyme family protein [Prevotellaceae bacterium]
MKKTMISLFALLLLAAQAQGADRQPLAVLVVGVDSWMFGDVLAHIVGEELKRGNPNLVPVTRQNFVQNKLKALRRASGDVDICNNIYKWAQEQGLSKVCLVEAKAGEGNATFSFTHLTQDYSAHLIDVASKYFTSCSADFTFQRTGAPGEMTPVELNKVAWEVAGRLQSSSCKSSPVCFLPMVWVEGGTYAMEYVGSPNIRNVTVSDFWIGQYEVTQEEWTAVMGSMLPGVTSMFGKGNKYPVYNVEYNDAMAFINALNDLTGKAYRLPTDAEWEYAARGGSMPKNCPGGCEFSGSNQVNEVAWHEGNRGGNPSYEVGLKAPNELGIYDMSGNVWEWCYGWYGYFSNIVEGSVNPTGPASGTERIARGGSCEYPYYCTYVRSGESRRGWSPDHNEIYSLGFRVVLPKHPVVLP